MSPEKKSHKRALEIITAYGAEQSAWPEADRAATAEALKESEHLQRQLQESLVVDDFLRGSHKTAVLDAEQVARRIAQQIPQQITWVHLVNLGLERLAEMFSSNAWKPALAASLTLSAGLAVGSTVYVPVEDWSQTEQYSFTMVGEEF
jgi:hypothetical protein